MSKVIHMLHPTSRLKSPSPVRTLCGARVLRYTNLYPVNAVNVSTDVSCKRCIALLAKSVEASLTCSHRYRVVEAKTHQLVCSGCGEPVT